MNIHKGAQVYVEGIGYGTIIKHIQEHHTSLVKIDSKRILLSSYKIMTQIPITVKILTFTGQETKSFYVDLTLTVAQLLSKVVDSFKVKKSSPNLYFKGIQLENDHISMKDLQVFPNAKFLAVSG